MKPAIEHIDISRDELQQLLDRARAALSEEDFQKLKAAVDALSYLTDLVADKDTTIRDLRQLLLPAATEKTREVLKKLGVDVSRPSEEPQFDTEKSDTEKSDTEKPDTEKIDPKKPGHGRNAADQYRGARRVEVLHESMTAGSRCPDCYKGKVYEQQEPKQLVRIVGQAPIQATIYQLQKLRCNLCGGIYTAQAPDGIGEDKYDETAAAMIAQLKYGSGMPFYRLEDLEESLGIPLPASTQWEIVEDAAASLEPAHAELIRQAAQGDVLHNDDTTMKVMALRHQASLEADERTGVFTSGIIATKEKRSIALFFTGRQHAGENLGDVLQHRARELAPPIRISDALSRNAPKSVELLVSNCLAHGRRRFVEIAPSFPQECRRVLEMLGEVYYNEKLARERELTPERRLRFHQDRSEPVMRELRAWFQSQLAEKKTEPNSGLGKAIRYMLNHWDALTLFLREPGAPLDNNICERALKKAILHRKNSLFYKTLNGAQVGDLYMSLIHTAELNQINPFEYLTELQRHAAEIAVNPERWMPWNYRETLERDVGI